ncbi:hypothetical protein ACMGF7_22035 [Serratia sp. BNK-17]|uniref:hypothetical protein n=1 Tax=Serratia sp. BNK-17 TaxID=3376154 RepID=UPI003B4311EC
MAMGCVFCGEEPSTKTKEHVIPQWLLRRTGDPSRLANFGYDMKSKKIRNFPFNSFTFPACDSCNSEYSVLEGDSEKALSKIMNGNEVKVEELNILLDWFDKVRVGLWLGIRQLNANPAGVTPNFYIKNRIGLHDRMLAIERVNKHPEGINFIGTETLSFALNPSVFCLRVNNFYFYSVSHMFLLAEGLGFPYPESSSLTKSKFTEVMLNPGDGVIKNRLVPFDLNVDGIKVYQPMLKSNSKQINLLSAGHVEKHFVDISLGIGNIFVETNNGLIETNYSDSILVTPNYIDGLDGQLKKANLNVLSVQDFYTDKALNEVSFEKLPEKERVDARMFFEAAKIVNNDIRENL